MTRNAIEILVSKFNQVTDEQNAMVLVANKTGAGFHSERLWTVQDNLNASTTLCRAVEYLRAQA